MSDNTSFIKGLRQIADFYETHPEIPTPYVDKLFAFLQTRDQMTEVARAIGTCEKGADDNYFWLRKTFGTFKVEWNVSRNVACRRVVVGTREVPEQVIAAHTEEIVEWHCDPILAPLEKEALEPGDPLLAGAAQ